jgi:hypothetical protein
LKPGVLNLWEKEKFLRSASSVDMVGELADVINLAEEVTVTNIGFIGGRNGR